MKRRFPVSILLVALVLAALIVDVVSDDADEVVFAEVDLASGSVIPVAAPPNFLSSTWFCAGGSADAEAFADHVVTMLNPGDRAVTVSLTAFAGRIAPAPANSELDDLAADDDGGGPEAESGAPAAVSTEPVVREIEIAPQTRRRIALSELVSGPVASALVEAPRGGVVVEHEVSSIHGIDNKPCATRASDVWHFAWGTTARDARELLVLFNPFPDDAIVDGRFSTENGVREPVRFDGLVIPARSTLAVDLGDDVTRRDEVAATITTRTGRIVVDRIVRRNGEGERGLTVNLGVPVPRTAWIFADGFTSEDVRERFVVYNPGADVAEVDIELVVDRPDENGIPEPVSLSLPPNSHSSIDLTADGRVPAGVAHAAVVRSANGVPVVAERVISTNGPDRRGMTVTTGSPLLAETWTFAAGATGPADDQWLVIFNPDPVVLAEVDVVAVVGGQRVPVSELQGVVIEAGQRRAIRVGERIRREDLALEVVSTEPVVIERGRYRVGEDERGMSNSIGVPSPEGIVAPADPVLDDAEVDFDDLDDADPATDDDAPPTAPDDVELPEPDETIVIDDPDADADIGDGAGDGAGDEPPDAPAGEEPDGSSSTTSGGVPATTP